MTGFDVVPTLVEVQVYEIIQPGTEDSRDPWIRYVGQTDRRLSVRLSEHIADAKAGRMSNEAFRSWLLKMDRYGKRPVIIAVETCVSYEAARLAEKHHIERCRRLYSDLLNLRDNPDRTQARPFSENYLRKVL